MADDSTTQQTAALWPRIRDFIRNILGRYQLFVVLFRWDKVYRREVVVTILALLLINYSILDMDSPYDIIALMIEVIIIWLQLGNEFSILPKEYRPHQQGLRLSAKPVTYFTHGDVTMPFAAVKAPPSEENLDMYNPFKGQNVHPETGLCSDFLNDHLITAKFIGYEVRAQIENYISSVHQIRYLAMRVANKKQHTTNGEKLCLDATAASMVDNAPVPVRKARYFDALLTAEAFRTRIYGENLRGVVEVNTDMTQYYPVESSQKDKAPRLADDYYRQVSGHIGATSLLISENQKIICLFQGSGKALEADKVHLGGSGSMDFKDARQNSGEDLRHAIRRCMARETAEETGLKSHAEEIYDNTLITGFFHWMDRAAKPEFSGLTRAGSINFAAQSRLDGDEIVRLEEIPVTLKTLDNFKDVLTYVIEHKINISLSSLMALHRMTIIAGYSAPDATEDQRQIYDQVHDFLFSGT